MFQCRVVILSLALLVTAAVHPVAVSAGWLYLLNDDPAGSRIYGFQVNESTGALTLISGFPVSVGAVGADASVSERMTIDPVNRRLYVVNDGSDSVQRVFDRRRDRGYHADAV